MVHRMLAAFFGAGGAHIGTQAAQLLCEVAAACHEGGGRTSDLGAIHVVGDAARHHFHVLFLQAGGGAMVACGGAGVTGFDTDFQLVGLHAGIPP
jgi:hypothetical protein